MRLIVSGLYRMYLDILSLKCTCENLRRGRLSKQAEKIFYVIITCLFKKAVYCCVTLVLSKFCMMRLNSLSGM